jgi:hypothetical protein
MSSGIQSRRLHPVPSSRRFDARPSIAAGMNGRDKSLGRQPRRLHSEGVGCYRISQRGF